MLGHSNQALADYRRVYYSPHYCPEEMRQSAGARIEALKGGPP